MKSSWPPSKSIIAGPAPLYGMCAMSTPAMLLNSSTARWVTEPLPAEPKRNWPGRAFASAMNSCTDFAGNVGCTTTTYETPATVLTGAKSLSVS